MAEHDTPKLSAAPATERGAPLDRSRPKVRLDQELITGRLIEHGAANYQFRRDQDRSYYVKLLTLQGERILWGKDLERAVRASATHVAMGDMVGARRVARETVTLTDQQRDDDGRIVSRREHLAHRNRWVVERPEFFAERARLARRLRDEALDAKATVREHPELGSTFLTLRAAEEFARRRIADAGDRERFVAMVKAAMVTTVGTGAPVPTVKLREPQKQKQRVQRMQRER